MPGLVGIVSAARVPELLTRLDRMLAAVCAFPWYHTAHHVNANWTIGIGQVHLGAVPTVTGPPRWVHGEPEEGFVAVTMDEPGRGVTIENDRLGMMPLYVAQQEGRLMFATEPKALLASGLLPATLDPAGLADLLRFGFVLGTKTLVQEIRCLGGGRRLRFDLDTAALSEEPTWVLTDHLGGGRQHGRRALNEVADRFGAAVERACQGPARVGMSLSGGYDSRTIAAAIDHQRHHVPSLTLDVPGGADQVIGSQIAALTNGSQRHHFLANSESFFAAWPDAVREMVWLSDGQYYDEACVMMPTLDRYRALGIDVVLRGHGGELARMRWAYELACNRKVLACRSRSALVNQLVRQMTSGMRPAIAPRVLSSALAEAVRDGPPAALAEALADVDPAWPVVDQVSAVYLREYLRRQTVPSLALLRSRVDVRLPFLDAGYVEAILRLRPSLRLGTRVHRHLLSRFNPALLKIANANTGAPAGATDWHQRLSRKRQLWLRRLFHYERYRHYVDVRRWLRGPLRAAVEAVLLDSRTLDRGLCQPDGVRRLWTAHRRGRADHGPAILLLVYLELWMRMFVDGEAWNAAAAWREPRPPKG